jgi:hypothetical protein
MAFDEVEGGPLWMIWKRNLPHCHPYDWQEQYAHQEQLPVLHQEQLLVQLQWLLPLKNFL